MPRLRSQVYLLSLLVLLSSACASNPQRTAKTLEQHGDAAYGQYVIAKEQGAKLLKDPTIQDSAKRPLAEAMVASKEPADKLQDALIEYSTVKAQVAAGKTTEDRLLIAQQNIDSWLAHAQPLINDLVRIVGGFLQ